MNRVPSVVFRAAVAAIVSFVARRERAVHAQAACTLGAAQEPAHGADEPEKNPFAPEPAPPLPAGMTGSDVNDPRYKLTPGLYDAGEVSMGIKHILLLKKPDTFQLGTTDPDDPKVQKTLGQIGIPGLHENAEVAAGGDCGTRLREFRLCVPGQPPLPWAIFMA